jgi:hypothetical protein
LKSLALILKNPPFRTFNPRFLGIFYGKNQVKDEEEPFPFSLDCSAKVASKGSQCHIFISHSS